MIILENKLQDDILDYMNDNDLSFDELHPDDQYILKFGDYPEHLKKEIENTYVGINNVLEFVYDKISKTQQEIKLWGTIKYLNDTYKGNLTITPDKVEIEFLNKKGIEFDPRNNQEHMNALNNLFNEVIREKLKEDMNENKTNKIIKLNEFNETSYTTRDEILKIIADSVIDNTFPDIGEVNGVTTNKKESIIFLHGDRIVDETNISPTIMVRISTARGIYDFNTNKFSITESKNN